MKNILLHIIATLIMLPMTIIASSSGGTPPQNSNHPNYKILPLPELLKKRHKTQCQWETSLRWVPISPALRHQELLSQNTTELDRAIAHRLFHLKEMSVNDLCKLQKELLRLQNLSHDGQPSLPAEVLTAINEEHAGLLEACRQTIDRAMRLPHTIVA